ncbi:MAG: glycosyltransferase [Halioglobus sp.]|jgi:dolichol-phosphate mannosyltransferase|nr:glycosyltransferase [Halioglobus sp.]
MAVASLSVIAPARNERDNVAALVLQIDEALVPVDCDYEIIIVDDGSTDGTDDQLRTLLGQHERLRVVTIQAAGQTAALWAGIQSAQGELIAMLDADLQNDPADLPCLLDALDQTGADLIQGDRSGRRQDALRRRFGSMVARFTRILVLGDFTRDTGCTLRVMRRQVAQSLPLDISGMHRFIPYLARRLGYSVHQMPVVHHARTRGASKYGLLDRAAVGLVDCFGVRRIVRRQLRCRPSQIPQAAQRRSHDIATQTKEIRI